MPQVRQNQCFAVPVLNLYSDRFSLPEKVIRFEAGISRPRAPGLGESVWGKGGKGTGKAEGSKGGKQTSHGAHAAVAFIDFDISWSKKGELDGLAMAGARVYDFLGHRGYIMPVE